MSTTVRIDAALYGALWGLYIEARDNGQTGLQSWPEHRARMRAAVARVRAVLDAEQSAALARFDSQAERSAP